jgi:hypothetical protein
MRGYTEPAGTGCVLQCTGNDAPPAMACGHVVRGGPWCASGGGGCQYPTLTTGCGAHRALYMPALGREGLILGSATVANDGSKQGRGAMSASYVAFVHRQACEFNLAANGTQRAQALLLLPAAAVQAAPRSTFEALTHVDVAVQRLRPPTTGHRTPAGGACVVQPDKRCMLFGAQNSCISSGTLWRARDCTCQYFGPRPAAHLGLPMTPEDASMSAVGHPPSPGGRIKRDWPAGMRVISAALVGLAHCMPATAASCRCAGPCCGTAECCPWAPRGTPVPAAP